MKCVVIVFLLSIINCHESVTKKKLRNNINIIKDDNNNNNNNAFPNFLPLQMPFMENKVGIPATEGEEYGKVQVDEEGAQASIPVQQTQPYQQPPKTTLSRIVETKYGKVQGLTVTLFPGSNNNNNNKNSHPFRNKLVDVFLSVPYASPPTKSHRFSPTQTPIPWDGVRTVIKPGFVCPQAMPDIRDESSALKDMPKTYLEYLRRVEPYLRNQSEDCLYLNIFSPTPNSPSSGGALSSSSSSSSSVISQDSKHRLKPVLVFIHGGKFSWGSGNLYDGTMLAAYADILFVTLNYRLGVLGFLNVNTSPNTKPRVANYGLMDQIAALHWIKGNIMYFGGDPENITMMGYEAGAACIHFLMSSPAVVPGLFHRVILMAGSKQAPWALVDDPSAVANALAESLNCTNINPSTQTNLSTSSLSGMGGGSSFPQPLGRERDSASFSKSSNSDPLLECLKNKHFSYFAKFIPPKFAVDFGPSVDGIVILQNFWTPSPPQIGKRDLNQKYDLLFGVSSSEMLTNFAETDLLSGFEVVRRDAILRTLIRNSYRYHRNEILATITNEYVDWERDIQHPLSARDLTLNAVTDCLSLAPVIAASESSQIGKSFFYVFEHATKDGLNVYQKSGGVGGEELYYFIGLPLIENILPFYPSKFPSNYTKGEMALSEILINYLSNFVHTGDPNEPNQSDYLPISKEKNKFKNILWDSYDRLHQKYLELTANKIRTRSHYRAHQMAIWLRLVPELQRTGAQYASALHNRMMGGYNPSLYVGNFRLPEELEAINDMHLHVDGLDLDDLYFNGSGIPPTPPTTCFSPLSSISSEIGRGNVGASVKKSFAETVNKTGLGQSFLAAYASNLPLTIAVGCSLLILNLFIFALLYYHHNKRRRLTESRLLITSANSNNSSNVESQQLNSFGEPPELLQSNSTTATSFHQSQSIYSYDDDEEHDDHDYYHQAGENVNFATFSNHERRHKIISSAGTQKSQVSKYVRNFSASTSHNRNSSQSRPTPTLDDEVLTFSPHNQVYFSHQQHQSNYPPPNHYKPHERERLLQPPPQKQNIQQFDQVNINMEVPTPTSSSCNNTEVLLKSQHFEVSTLPIKHHHNPQDKLNQEKHSTTGTLPSKKPVPPTRNISNYSIITQRQLFSVIISLFTFGIL